MKSITVLMILAMAAFGALHAQKDAPKYFLKNGVKHVNASAISNLKQYTDFSKSDLEKLSKSGFLLVPGPKPGQSVSNSALSVYFDNYENGAPSFIGSDLVLLSADKLLDETRRQAEENRMLALISGFDSTMYFILKADADKNKERLLNPAYDRALRYFAVACDILGIKTNADKTPLADEIKRIALGRETHASTITSTSIDYSIFSRSSERFQSENAKRYAQIVAWHTSTAFSLDTDGDLAAAGLIVLTINESRNKSVKDKYDQFIKLYDFFNGEPDGITMATFPVPLRSVLGQNTQIRNLTETKKFTALKDSFKKLYNAYLRVKTNTSAAPVFSLIPKRALPEDEVFDALTKPGSRDFPRALDVPAAYGSVSSREILFDVLKENESWPTYERLVKEEVLKTAKITERTKKSTIPTYWLYCLESLFERNYSESYPLFADTKEWQVKTNATFLASHMESKFSANDSISEKPAAPRSVETQLEYPRSYLEPGHLLYKRLSGLAEHVLVTLTEMKAITEETSKKLYNFGSLMSFCDTISSKELAQLPMTARETERVNALPFELASYMTTAGQFVPTDSYLTDVLRELKGTALTNCTGPAFTMFVVVESDGKLRLLRGSTSSFYEFRKPTGDALDSKKWTELIKSGNVPASPAWLDDLKSDGKAIPVLKSPEDYIKSEPKARVKK